MNIRNEILFMPNRGPVNEVYTDRVLNKKIDTLKNQEFRIPYFRKNPCYGSHIFECMVCNNERIFGQGLGEPANTLVFITCEGSCKGNSQHKFIRIHRGREIKTFARISSDT